MGNVLAGRAEANGTSIEVGTEKALDNQSVRRFVNPDDIAQLALFLAARTPARFRDKCSPSTATRSTSERRTPSAPAVPADAPDVPDWLDIPCDGIEESHVSLELEPLTAINSSGRNLPPNCGALGF